MNALPFVLPLSWAQTIPTDLEQGKVDTSTQITDCMFIIIYNCDSAKQWTPKQHNKTAQLKAETYPRSNFSLFNCRLYVVL